MIPRALLALLVICVVAPGATAREGAALVKLKPAWSPDGTSIAFEGVRGGGGPHVYVMQADGTGVRQVVAGRRDSSEPTWSADSSRIAYLAGDKAIRIVGADGSGDRALARGALPDWSPNGKAIAFTRDFLGIWTVRPSGAGLHRVTNKAGPVDTEPTWAPDSRRIAFVGSSQATGKTFLGVTNAIRRGPIRRYLTTRTFVAPEWAPRGDRIAFADLKFPTRICVFSLGTKRVKCLKAGSHPSWSPDGRRIAFDRNGALWTMRSDGSGLKRLG